MRFKLTDEQQGAKQSPTYHERLEEVRSPWKQYYRDYWTGCLQLLLHQTENHEKVSSLAGLQKISFDILRD